MHKRVLAALAILLSLALSAASAQGSLVKVGEKAPDFALPNQNGDTVRLGDYLGKKNVVLVFFGQAYSDETTNRLRPYQEHLAQFERVNTQVIAITVESVYLVEALATDLHLSFPVLSDYGIHFDKQVSLAYGVFRSENRLSQEQGMLGVFARYPDPYTIVIDKNGIVQHVEENPNPDRILEICKRLD